MITIYTDGSCNKEGIGGWGFVIESPSLNLKGYGGEAETTNNRMELMAVLKVLEVLKVYHKKIKDVKIITDSKYVIGCATDWKRIANIDLWNEYDELADGFNITFEWVKGHSGDKMNELVDTLAKRGIDCVYT